MDKRLAFALIALLAVNVVLAARQFDNSCVPLHGICQTSDQCCPGLRCLFYAAKCISYSSIIISGDRPNEELANWNKRLIITTNDLRNNNLNENVSKIQDKSDQ